jgi:hypothetical protein
MDVYTKGTLSRRALESELIEAAANDDGLGLEVSPNQQSRGSRTKTE